jgi:pyruvate dehydrogenase E1 component alpha subunit
VASRAAAYGLPGIEVDGNDVLAVAEAAEKALGRARQGGGPTLIECKKYRWNGSSKSAVEPAKDPIENMENYLSGKGLFSTTWKQQIVTGFNRELDEAARHARHHG